MGEVHQDRFIPAYSITAALYDRMVGLYAFEQWRENFERLERRYGLDITCCADVACGTGLAASYLTGRGAEVYGFDRSPEMLKAAADTTGGRHVRLLRQDMRYLCLPSKVGTIICATDSLNHLLREEDLRRTLNSFRAALRPGGYALFDMNTTWQLREGSDTEPWDFEVDGVPMRWFSKWDERERTATLRLVFPGLADEGGEPAVEVHRERAYPAGWILAELERAGFQEAEVLDAAGLGKISERTRRLQFIACKSQAVGKG